MIIKPNREPSRLEDILPLIEKLTVQEKAQLVKRLMGSLASSSDSVVEQIKVANPEQLGEMLRVIANRVASEDV